MLLVPLGKDQDRRESREVPKVQVNVNSPHEEQDNWFSKSLTGFIKRETHEAAGADPPTHAHWVHPDICV